MKVVSVASLPMRNWNASAFILTTSLVKVASLPMRNWNPYVPHPVFCKFLLRAFLWGIETLLPKYAWSLWHCCEPSYEELKHNPTGFLKVSGYWLRAFLWGIETASSRTPIVAYNVRCEPSYEELKLFGVIIHFSSCHPALRAFLWGIETYFFNPYILDKWTICCEPSYEELKLCLDFFYSVNAPVASLPMRNWNERTKPPISGSEVCCEPSYEELKPFLIDQTVLFLL